MQNRVLVDHAGEIHELGKPDDLRVIAIGQQLFDGRSAPAVSRCWQARNDARELDADVHDVSSAEARKNSMPSVPSTLAISCGSQMTVVTP